MEVEEIEERLKRGESVHMDAETYAKWVAAQNTRNYEDGIITARLLPSPITKDDAITFLARYGNNATRFALFLHLAKYYILNLDAYAAGLRLSYVSSMGFRRDDVLDCFRLLPDRFAIMTPEERQAWEAMPTEITIYRGCDKDEAKVGIFGTSWTLSRAVAEFFAWRYDEKDSRRVVVSKTIHKNSIMAYFTERYEEEVIVDVEDGADIVAKKPTQAYYGYMEERLKYNRSKG